MTFDWHDFNVVADSLSTNTDEESLRSAVGRYYYCAFNVTYKYLKDKGKFQTFSTSVYRGNNGKPTKHENTFRSLEVAITTPPDIRDDFEQASIDLKNLREIRNKADYDSNSGLDWKIAVVEAKDLCKDIVDLIDGDLIP